MTKTKQELPAPGKATAGALLVATFGVVVQIVSGVDYPPVPPVFFIQLIPAALVYFGRWRWTAALAAVAGVFLTVGLFVSGAAKGLTDFGLDGGVGGSIGLWIQSAAVVVAIVTGVMAFLRARS